MPAKFFLVLINETLQFYLICLKEDIHGRFVVIQAPVQEAHILLNLYAPTKCSEQCDFFEIISSVLEDINTDSNYIPLINRVQGPYCKIWTEFFRREKRGSVFYSTDRENEVNKTFIISLILEKRNYFQSIAATFE